MISARPNCAAECGTTAAMAAPSRTCRCQSSGRVMVRVTGRTYRHEQGLGTAHRAHAAGAGLRGQASADAALPTAAAHHRAGLQLHGGQRAHPDGQPVPGAAGQRQRRDGQRDRAGGHRDGLRRAAGDLEVHSRADARGHAHSDVLHQFRPRLAQQPARRSGAGAAAGLGSRTAHAGHADRHENHHGAHRRMPARGLCDQRRGTARRTRCCASP
jgi:hypothetical protein